MFEVRRIDRSWREAEEPLGSKSKFWFRDHDRLFLFKAEDRRTGEDWAEKVVCHLCELLGLPHVHYELAAEYDGDRLVAPGVICETCAPQPVSLVLGNQLLFAFDPSYSRESGKKFKVREHTVSAVTEVLQFFEPPSADWMTVDLPRMDSALDVFVGYVLLDAWVANQDRHHANWGVLFGKELRLAPTFDHGAALARNLSDSQRQQRLNSRDKHGGLAAFASRARSEIYSGVPGDKPLGTHDAFWEFAGRAKSAAEVWLRQLQAIDESAVEQILQQVPEHRMTATSQAFTLQLLRINRTRLLEGSVQL